jgi:2-keto-myo-inositol isomerase
MDPSRRQLLTAMAGTALASGELAPASAGPIDQKQDRTQEFRFSLNTSTIRGQNIPLADEVGIAAKAGYNAIEPWISELEAHVKNGGNLRDLGRRIRDAGLAVESAIGFAEWIVDDDSRRKRGLENARVAMDMVRQIGGTRLAAPPVGATDQNNLNLYRAAERYRELLNVGLNIGVVPQVEVWGFSRSLSKLGECALVAIEAKHPQACILADVYHLHKGGSGFDGLGLLSAASMQVFHMNDYPATPARAEITDADRIYPGDGVAPLVPMLRTLRRLGFRGILSLELFNREYWKQDALTVAQRGLEKMRGVARQAMQNP